MDVASTARGVWSALGGMLSSSISPAGSNSTGGAGVVSESPPPAAGGRWFSSRSAPTSTPLSGPNPPVTTSPAPARQGELFDARRMSANLLKWGSSAGSGGDTQENGEGGGGKKPQWVALYDVGPLFDGGRGGGLHPSGQEAAPFLVAHFPYNLSNAHSTSHSKPGSSSGDGQGGGGGDTLLPQTHVFTSPSAISALSLSPSGALLAVADGDGAVVRVFQVRSRGVVGRGSGGAGGYAPVSPRASPAAMGRKMPSLSSSPVSNRGGRRRGSSSASSASTGPSIGAGLLGTSPASGVGGGREMGGMGRGEAPGEPHRNVWHLYDLVRGVSRARVESVVWAGDERWVGVGTGTGTLREFWFIFILGFGAE